MRCPKCGYITFDRVETCGGCKKNIAKYAQDLSGVIFQAPVPDFLRFGVEPEPEPEEEEVELEESEEEEAGEIEGVDLEEEELDLDAVATEEDAIEFAEAEDEDTEISIDLGKATTPKEPESQEIEFDLDLGMGVADDPAAEEIQMAEELGSEIAFDLSLESEDTVAAPSAKKAAPAKKTPPPAPKADAGLGDLGDLDFSLEDDLGGLELELDAPKKPKPAASKKSTGIQDAKEVRPSLDLSGLDFNLDAAIDGPSSSGLSLESVGADEVLPDLELGDIDFNTSLSAPAGSATGKKLSPAAKAAKTGTALDSFDIDLGDLLGGDAPATQAKPKAAKKK